MTPTIEDLVTLDLRAGTVTVAEPNGGAGDPVYRLWRRRGSTHGPCRIADRVGFTVTPAPEASGG